MSISATALKVARKVIRKMGINCVFTRKIEASFDPVKGEKVSNDFVFTSKGLKDEFSEREMSGTNILSGDVKLTIENSGDVPMIGDDCLIGAISYRVMNVKPVDPQGVDIIYELQLRI